MSVYEVQSARGRKKNATESWSYRELAKPLVEYVTRLGFTHVEFLPRAEHAVLSVVGLQSHRLLMRRPAGSARRTIFNFSSTRCTRPASA